ncbi:recombinase family protein [Paenibacillus polymyxa]|uniref:recombinase family protein n=1 Tax=Paenibacillus polymyxa TaxID=1406 RepID=UPI00211D5541|nr:recombinase family protein [Paenibacillus polymyxa]
MMNFNNSMEFKEVAVYARVSSEDQQERETIENQVEFAEKYCELHRMNIVGWYKDDGVSGTIPFDQRPAGKRLIEEAKSGKFKTVLIYNMKRLGRKARVTLDAIYQLEEYGVKIKSMTEPFDTGDPMGRFIITVLAGQAEFDRDTLLDTLWHGANRAARLGKWLGGIVPYGYTVNSDRFLEIDEEPLLGKEDLSQAGVIRLMYDLVGRQKWSTIKVADYFNSLKIPPSYVRDSRKIKRGQRKENTAGIWRPGRIRSMIVNKTYMGIHEYGKRATREREIIIREVPAIVSKELWEQAQLTLRENQLEGMRNAKRQYLMRSLIKCGCCGLTYTGTAYKSTGRSLKSYYVCGGKFIYKGPILGKCPSKNIPAEWIETTVWNECVNFIKNPGDALQQLSEGLKDKNKEANSLLNEKNLVLSSLNSKASEKQNILNLYRQKIISALDVERQLLEITKETASLEIRIKEIDTAIRDENSVKQKLQSAELLLLNFREKIESEPSFEVKREIVKTLVRDIIVENGIHPDSGKPMASVNVRYSFDSPQGVLHTDTDSKKLQVKNAPDT